MMMKRHAIGHHGIPSWDTLGIHLEYKGHQEYLFGIHLEYTSNTIGHQEYVFGIHLEYTWNTLGIQ